MGQALASYGMTPMAGRMWGWLLICDPPEQTAADLAEALQASRGAISGTARMLATAGMIRRTKRGGDRREFFSAPPEAFDEFLRERRPHLPPFPRDRRARPRRRSTDRPPAARARLEEFRDVFAFIEQEVPAVVDRFLRERCRHRPAGRTHPHDRGHPHRAAHQDATAPTGASPSSTSTSRKARSSASSARTGRARRRRCASCSTSSARPPGGPRSSASRRRPIPVAIHRRIGYLPGEFDLYDRLTGADTIAYFANLRGGVDAGYVAELIERLDLDPSRRFKEYSKGNKQKVGLVVALQHKPDLLILDEPTSGLDPLVQQTFFEIVREARAEGRTVFLSSHIIDEVDRTCDRVAIIREGRLVQVDSHRGHPRLAFHHVELTFARRSPAASSRRSRASATWKSPSATVRMRVAGPIGSVLAAAAPHGIVDVVSREPNLEDVVPRPVRCTRWPLTSARSAWAGPMPWSRVMGLRSIYAKTVRDSRRAALVVGRPGRAVHAGDRRAVRARVRDDGAPPDVHRGHDRRCPRPFAACSASRSTSRRSVGSCPGGSATRCR